MREVERSAVDGRRSQLGRVAIEVAATVGYDAMRAGDIADAAGVVRRTFRRYFPDKQAAFEYGYREASEELRAAVQAAYDEGSTPVGRARACLRAIAGFLAADPARAEALVIHGHAAGSVVAGVHQETMRRLAALILQNAAALVPPDRDAQMLAQTVAGGIYEVVHSRVSHGQVGELPGLVGGWSVVAMAPYAAIARRADSTGSGVGLRGAVVGGGCVDR